VVKTCFWLRPKDAGDVGAQGFHHFDWCTPRHSSVSYGRQPKALLASNDHNGTAVSTCTSRRLDALRGVQGVNWRRIV
jgi:hypothetical protein